MDPILAWIWIILIFAIFCVSPLFWFIVFGCLGHPGWFIVAFVWWALK